MTTTDDYQQQTEALAATAVAQVAAVWAVWQAGQLTEDEAVQLVAAVITAANAAATGLADASVSAQIETLSGIVTPTSGLPPADDTERLTLAARTILDDVHQATDNPPTGAAEDPAETAVMRVQRLAHCEPLETAQRVSVEVMDAQPLVEGWTRHMDADPCQLCRWWWREGRVWPKNHPFQSHKGCNCQPKPVLAQYIQSTGYTRRLERNSK